jgi:hypothetical protein
VRHSLYSAAFGHAQRQQWSECLTYIQQCADAVTRDNHQHCDTKSNNANGSGHGDHIGRSLSCDPNVYYIR